MPNEDVTAPASPTPDSQLELAAEKVVDGLYRSPAPHSAREFHDSAYDDGLSAAAEAFVAAGWTPPPPVPARPQVVREQLYATIESLIWRTKQTAGYTLEEASAAAHAIIHSPVIANLATAEGIAGKEAELEGAKADLDMALAQLHDIRQMNVPDDPALLDQLVYALVNGSCDLADRDPGREVWDQAKTDIELILPVIREAIAAATVPTADKLKG